MRGRGHGLRHLPDGRRALERRRRRRRRPLPALRGMPTAITRCCTTCASASMQMSFPSGQRIEYAGAGADAALIPLSRHAHASRLL